MAGGIAGMSIEPQMMTTAFTLDGYRIERNLGIVRGIIVRSRSIFGTIGASFQTLAGGDITLFSKLCEETREHAYDRMAQHASELGANAVIGVTNGFKKELDIVGIGYRAELKGRQVTFALGFSHPIVFDIPTGIEIAVDKQTHITVTGVDRQLVGQVAANIRRMRKPDPYKQKGVRYMGEVLKKKVGKTGAK